MWYFEGILYCNFKYLKTKHNFFFSKLKLPAYETLFLGTKTNVFVLYRAKVAVCSETEKKSKF